MQPEKTYGLMIGKRFIADLMNPKPEEIDLAGIEARLQSTYRFTNNKAALTVAQHRHVVRAVAMRVRDHTPGQHDCVLDWAFHHDDHEGIIGDIPGPLKSLIAQHSPILSVIEMGLDRAICEARGVRFPPPEIRAIVHRYDKIAETIEWVHVLRNDLEPWNMPIPDNVNAEFIHRHLDIARFS